MEQTFKRLLIVTEVGYTNIWGLYLTWINFNPNMD